MTVRGRDTAALVGLGEAAEPAVRDPAAADLALPVDPGDVGEAARLHELRLRDDGAHKRSGSYYTPAEIVAGLLRITLDPLLADLQRSGPGRVGQIRVLDPACGTGNFLLAAGRRIQAALEQLGVDRDEAASIAFGSCVGGSDIDAVAVGICRARIAEAAGPARASLAIQERVLCLDSLLAATPAEPDGAKPPLLDGPWRAPAWSSIIGDLPRPRSGFDLVVGNPPFLSQLATSTATGRSYRARLKERFGDQLRSYTDPAALFWLLAAQLADPNGGRVCMILPVSFLAARDSQPARRHSLLDAQLHGVWVAGERVFPAAVDVCAPILVRRSGVRPAEEVRTWSGSRFHPGPVLREADLSETWSTLLASVRGTPAVQLRDRTTLGTQATVAADFRDQFYGVAPHVIDSREGSADESQPKLATVGLVDLARFHWGQRPAVVAGRRLAHPRVAVEQLDAPMKRWAGLRLAPKLLVATQSRALEVVVDQPGELLPLVPLISVSAPAQRLWHLAAAVASPPVLAWAYHRTLGTGLGLDRIRLSVAQVAAIPLPEPGPAWDEGAELLRGAGQLDELAVRTELLGRFGAAMCRAYGIGDPGPVTTWWLACHQRRRRPTAAGDRPGPQ